MRESVRKSGGFEEALVYHINFSFVEPALLLRSPSEGLRKVLVVISNIEDAVDFIREWTAAPRNRRSSVRRADASGLRSSRRCIAPRCFNATLVSLLP
jgi:hypothetical protein